MVLRTLAMIGNNQFFLFFTYLYSLVNDHNVLYSEKNNLWDTYLHYKRHILQHCLHINDKTDMYKFHYEKNFMLNVSPEDIKS